MTGSAGRDLAASLPGGVPEALQPDSKVLVTGCAGFIGSHLTEALLALGYRVEGVDCLTDYYAPEMKRENLASSLAHPNFTFHEADLLDLDPVALLSEVSVCFHLAAQAGVRASWGRSFEVYLSNNVASTQYLLEACLNPVVRENLVRFVYSSSSSVYGDQLELPVTEHALPRPRSPYGVTKLAAEHLCVLYAENFQVPTVSLRYFTVYGPRQRPDMAFRKFVARAMAGEEFRVYGDGSQTRDFTYVVDAVRANLLAVGSPVPGDVYNVGGGSRISLRAALEELTGLLDSEAPGHPPKLVYDEMAKGDVQDTFADRSHIEKAVGYRPTVPFADGLAYQVGWDLARRGPGA